jgi:hypothetical protein
LEPHCFNARLNVRSGTLCICHCVARSSRRNKGLNRLLVNDRGITIGVLKVSVAFVEVLPSNNAIINQFYDSPLRRHRPLPPPG